MRNILKPYYNRGSLLEQLAERGICHACEVGVFRGEYSEEILTKIPSLEKLYLVDPWEHQENYVDVANYDDEGQECHLNDTKSRVAPWGSKVEILRGYSTDMCHTIEDNSLDWCYIDARHDYKGCKEDIEAFWPKVRDGGVLSGHDYHTAQEIQAINSSWGDWSICEDGTIHQGAVKGAVDDFAEEHGLQVLVSYWERDLFTWSIAK